MGGQSLKSWTKAAALKLFNQKSKLVDWEANLMSNFFSSKLQNIDFVTLGTGNCNQRRV